MHCTNEQHQKFGHRLGASDLGTTGLEASTGFGTTGITVGFCPPVFTLGVSEM